MEQDLIDALRGLLDVIPVEYNYHGNPMDKELDAAMQNAEAILAQAEGIEP